MSKIFVPNRGLGYVSNEIPLQVRYIKSRKENLIVTCVGRSFHTYGVSHFGLLSVGSLHASDITCMTADTYHVYTACENVIYAWRRGTELQHTYRGHRKSITLMIPFGVHLISVDESSSLRVWDIKTESQVAEFTFSNETFEISALMHPETYINKVLLGSKQGELQLWNINTSKLIFQFDGWNKAISCLQQAPALDVVAVGLTDGRIILHNLKFNETLMEFLQDWGNVTSISFRSDGNPLMATGSTSGHIVFWDLEQKKVFAQLMKAHQSAVSGMQFLPNEALLVTSSPDNTLKLWIFDMTDGGPRLLRIHEGHSAAPTCIRYHGANGNNILSAAGDSSLRIFNTQTEQFNKNLGKASFKRKVSKKRGRLVEDPLLMPPIVQFTSETTREKEWDNIACMHLGIPIISTWSYSKLKMGDLKLLPSRLHKKNREPGDHSMATSLHLTHCGHFVLIGYSNGYVDRFNIQSGLWRDSYGKPSAHEGAAVRGVASDGLNQIVITGGSEGLVKCWKFKSKDQSQPAKTINLEEAIQFFRLHSEISLLAIALEDFSLRIIDLDTLNVIRKFDGLTAQITDVSFTPNGRWLISSSMDCVIRTWDISSALLVDQFRTLTACISLDVSPMGDSLITAHVDYLGIFMWCNRTLYQRVTLKALDIAHEADFVELPECQAAEIDTINETIKDDEDDDEDFASMEQLSEELVTLSGLASSRWQNLLNIDVIRAKNRPKMPPKAPKSAPFFLPTVSGLNMEFDLKVGDDESKSNSKGSSIEALVNLTEFGKLLSSCEENDGLDCNEKYAKLMEKLKTMGPSMVQHEINSLAPEEGGSVQVMLEFLKFTVTMMKTNKNFELIQAYLGVFLKKHAETIADEPMLKSYLPNIEGCLKEAWIRLQDKFMYNLCVVKHVKNQVFTV